MRVKDFGELSSVSIVVSRNGRRLKRWGGAQAKYGTFVFLPPLFTASWDRRRGRILIDFVDCDGKREREPSVWPVVLGQCACLQAEKCSDVIHSFETCFYPKPGELMF